MKKKTWQKVIIIISLILISSQIIYPININAAPLNWDNPNSGRNVYKFKLSDYLNSQMVMQVVGCTGVVNKISGVLSDLMSGNFSEIKDNFLGVKEKIKEISAVIAELTAATAVSPTPIAGPGLSTSISDLTLETVKIKSTTLEKLEKERNRLLKEQNKREECLNGIAYTLAKNQLVAMTKQTMNWVTSGFNGDPMYVRNVNNFMRSVENEVLYAELDMFKNIRGDYNTADYPYARNFSQSVINSRQSAQNFAESTKQDLTNYLVGETTIEEFSNDFSKGGWAGWLGLTQHPQNNPLGFTMINIQNIADKQTQETQNIKDETAQSGGMLSQKKCKVKALTKKGGQIKIEQAQVIQALDDARNKLTEAEYYYDQAGGNGNDLEDLTDAEDMVVSAREQLKEAENNVEKLNASIEDLRLEDECAEWEVVTPGSLIQDKVSAYLGSPERQLEMADDINKVLNTLFANLIAKLRLDGLSSLGTNSDDFSGVSGGWGSNDWTAQIDSGGNKFTGGGFDENRPFDLTKDLGNIYNHANPTKLGSWNANTNITTPINGTKGDSLLLGRGVPNTYYVVNVRGNTKLFNDGYSVWEVGDRAFFDGTNWQNWKKGTDSPIIKRGIIQLQQDYIVVSKELLKIMPSVMPTLGELDYCIPGPNPNWQINGGITYEAFANYVSGLKTTYISGQGRDRVTIEAPSEKPESELYQNYKKIFDGSNLWEKVLNSSTNIYMANLASDERAPRGTFRDIFDGEEDGTWRGDRNIAIANDEVSELIINIFEALDVFNIEYPKTIEKTYGTIQKQYLMYENTGIKKPNPSWIPMAQDGLTVTKKMLAYNEEINEATEDLKEAIAEADSNIDKLGVIRSEVGKIIKAAQERRDKKQPEILEWIIVNNKLTGKDPNIAGVTAQAEALSIYNSCQEEENVNYLDYQQIIVVEETGRCFDKLDNDFDGLVDLKDPDCSGSKTRTSGAGSGTETSNASGGSNIVEGSGNFVDENGLMMSQ